MFDAEETRRLYEVRWLYRAGERAGCKSAVKWVIFGYGVEPTPAEFSELVSKLDPELRSLLSFLLDFCPHSSQLSIQILLESEEEWNHPVQVLSRPRPTMEALYAAFEQRRLEGDLSAGFLALGERLKRAADLELAARRRREATQKSGREFDIPGSP